MSGDVPFQYVPLDKLKVYRNHVLVNSILRKLNFSSRFSLTEVPGTDSVDFDTSLSSLNGALNDLSDVAISNPTVKQVLRHDGTNWKNALALLDDLGDVVLTNPQNGDHLVNNGVNWVNQVAPSLDDLTDVDILNPAIKQVIRHDGTNWKNALASLNDNSDVVITNPQSGDHIVHDGITFVNQAGGVGGGATELDDLSDAAITNPQVNQSIFYDGAEWTNQHGATKTETYSNKTISANNNTITATSTAVGDILASNGTKFVRKARGTSLQVLRTNLSATNIEWASLDSLEKVGKSVASGTGSATEFTIAHELGSNPAYASIDCSSHAIPRTFTTDSISINVVFSSAPESGTDNVTIFWRVVA